MALPAFFLLLLLRDFIYRLFSSIGRFSFVLQAALLIFLQQTGKTQV
jgi:hypothetical protein